MSRSQTLRYGIDDKPNGWLALLYGWQHTLVDISPFVLPLPIALALGFNETQTAEMINFGLVAMGLATLLQTTLGNRLPIVQGPSATLVGAMAPLAASAGGPAMWGGIFLGGVAETLMGGTRLVGLLRPFLPARVCGTIIIVIGLSLGQLALRLSAGSGSAVEIALAVGVVVVVFLLQAAPNFGKRFRRSALVRTLAGGSIFFAIWTVGLGAGSVLGRVDWQLVQAKPWFSLPTLFPYGGPGFGWQFPLVASVVILVAYLGSMVESIGDYAATCNVAGVNYTKRHMNRGIMAEGLGSILSAVLGAVPCTSYTQNIGIIATTRVASRFVVQVAAMILMLYGLCPKFGALLVAMPRSVLGGVFVIVCGMIVASGFKLLQADNVALDNVVADNVAADNVAAGNGTDTDGWVVGMTLVVSLAVPALVRSPALANQVQQLPPAASLLLTNSIVLAVLLGIGLEQLSRLLNKTVSASVE